MNEQAQPQYSTADEITLEDLVIAIRDFIREALGKWWLFAVLFLMIGGYMVYDAWTTPVTYQATFTFMRDDEDGGSMSGVASILGQFGFGGSRSRFNLDRVLELAKSRRIVQNTIFERAEIDGAEDFLGNHLIREYELDDQWKEKWSELEGFRFVDDNVESLDSLERSALKRLYGFIVGNEDRKGLISASYSEESTILSFSGTTIDEELSIELITHLYENLAEFYVTKSTEKQQQTYDIVKTKADSIGQLLASKELEYARFRDANQNLYSNIAKLREDQLRRDIEKLNIIHAEALKNVEIADFTLRNATPVIQELDKPVPPLEPIIESKVKAGVIGMLLSVILGSAIILGLRLRERIKNIA